MSTPIHRANYFPISRFLWGTGYWIGLWLAVVAQDLAGLNFSQTIPFSYRIPAKVLCYVGAFSLALMGLAWCERRLNSSSSANAPKVKRVGAIVLLALCIAAPVIEYLTSGLLSK
jgi:hypothetical protein